MKKKFNWLKLFFSLILDLIGVLTYLIPVIGEFLDVLWSPIYAMIIHHMYNSKSMTTIAFIEEFLPATDILPTATIFWCIESFGGLKK